MLDDTPRCRGTRQDGTPCQAPPHAIGASGYCWAHDPTRGEERHAARVKGGQNKATAARVDRLVPATLRPVVTKLLDALDGVETGTLSPRQGAAMAAIASAIVRVYDVGVLSERVAELEALAGQRERA
jgi:hypothetical protein